MRLKLTGEGAELLFLLAKVETWCVYTPFTSFSRLELDSFYFELELDRNVLGLELVSVDYGPQSTLIRYNERAGDSQFLNRVKDDGAVEGESPACLILQDPGEHLPRKKSWHSEVAARILFVILIAAVPLQSLLRKLRIVLKFLPITIGITRLQWLSRDCISRTIIQIGDGKHTPVFFSSTSRTRSDSVSV